MASLQPESSARRAGAGSPYAQTGRADSYTPLKDSEELDGGAFGHVRKLCKKHGGAQEFKNYVVTWSAAYYVAYGLLITVAFSLIFSSPKLRNTDEFDYGTQIEKMMHYRLPSKELDAVLELLYYVFASSACYYSAWGLMLSVEWSLRVGSVPHECFDEFMIRLEQAKPTTTCNPWHWGWDKKFPFPHSGTCWSKAPAYDPFFFFPHTIDSLFLAGSCLLYLKEGAPQATILLATFLSLKRTVRNYGGIVFEAAWDASNHILDESSPKEKV